MKKILIMATISYSIDTLIKNQPKYLSEFFDEIEYTAADTGEVQSILDREGGKFYTIPMERKITPFKDLMVLYKLIVYFYKSKPDIIYTFTPKAGLLGMIAGFFSFCPTRIHNVVGMPLMEATGRKKVILQWTEKLTYLFATHVYCNSFGLKEYINDTLTKKEVKVIGQGSINGVDSQFYNDTFTKEEKNKIRENLGFGETDFIISFMGRIVKDKGVDELVEAFKLLNQKYKNIKLLVVGKFEEDLNPISNATKTFISENDSVKLVGFQNDLRELLSISDLFVLPSYREGLPNSLIEAGSYGIPLVATDINGCNEIIIDGVNGKLVKKKDSNSLYLTMEELYLNKDLYDKLKNNVRESIVSRYQQDYFLEELKNNLLRDANLV